MARFMDVSGVVYGTEDNIVLLRNHHGWHNYPIDENGYVVHSPYEGTTYWYSTRDEAAKWANIYEMPYVSVYQWVNVVDRHQFDATRADMRARARAIGARRALARLAWLMGARDVTVLPDTFCPLSPDQPRHSLSELYEGELWFAPADAVTVARRWGVPETPSNWHALAEAGFTSRSVLCKAGRLGHLLFDQVYRLYSPANELALLAFMRCMRGTREGDMQMLERDKPFRVYSCTYIAGRGLERMRVKGLYRHGSTGERVPMLVLGSYASEGIPPSERDC